MTLLVTKIKNAGIWQTIEVIGLVVLQFVFFAIMARILNKADFGIMAIVNSIIAFGYIFAEGGMGFALIQRKSVTDKHISAALHGAFLMGFLLFLILLLSASFMSIVFENPDLKIILRIISLNFIFLSIGNVSLGLLHKNFKFKQAAIVNLFSASVSFSLGILLGFLGQGVWSLVIALLLLSLLKSIGLMYFAPITYVKGFHIKEFKELFSFGFGIILLKLNNYVGNYGVILLLAKIFNISTLGVFERCFQIKTLPSQYISNILDNILFPSMAEIQDNDNKIFRVYHYSIGLVNSIFIPLSIFLFFFSDVIVNILLGPKWPEAVIPLKIMFITLPFSGMIRMSDAVIRAKGLLYKNAKRKFMYVIFLLISTSYGAYNYGLTGAALAISLSYIFNFITILFLIKGIFNKSYLNLILIPSLPGIKLSIYILMALLLTSLIFGIWSITNLIHFLTMIVVFSMIIPAIIKYQPDFYGEYLKIIIVHIFQGKSKLNI